MQREIILTAKNDKRVEFYDGATHARLAALDMPASVHELALSPDGTKAYGSVFGGGVFGKNVEDAFGRWRYLLFYVAGGFVANATQTAVTLIFGSAGASTVPVLGASGAIAAVLGAYIVLYPNSRVLGLLVIIPIRLPAWVFLGVWFLYQLYEANYGLFSASANGGGVAFSAHVGGFLFGVIVAVWLVRAGTARARAGMRPRFG